MCVPLAKYGEAADREKLSNAETFFILCAVGSDKLTLRTDTVLIITLRATSMNTHFEERDFAPWVDAGQLRISRLISLKNAAEEVVARLNGTPFGDHLEELGRSPEGILEFAMTNIFQHGIVVGKKWPASTFAPIPANAARKMVISASGENLSHLGEREPLYTGLSTTQQTINEFVRYGKGVSGSI